MQGVTIQLLLGGMAARWGREACSTAWVRSSWCSELVEPSRELQLCTYRHVQFKNKSCKLGGKSSPSEQ